ncbi:MAG: methyltransferase domain-containing protein [Gemmatimonadales bacterium]
MIPLSCPRCRYAVFITVPTIHCAGCDSRYPVVGGIPDLRTAPDPWIGMAEDRAKGLAVDSSAPPGFEAAVRTYWAITPETTPADAARHIDHVLGALERSREWVASLDPPARVEEEWLDLGCGTADIACAAPRGVRVTGIDVAYRWLVVARRRLDEAGVDAELICGNAQSLPFPEHSFDRVVALGTVEHCADLDAVLRETMRVLRPGGRLHLRTTNRFSVLPEPHVGLWGVGWLPRAWADRYVRWRGGRGFDHHYPRGPRELSRAMQRAGFTKISARASPMLESERHRVPLFCRPLIPLYDVTRGVPMLNLLIRSVAPMLDLEGVAS